MSDDADPAADPEVGDETDDEIPDGAAVETGEGPGDGAAAETDDSFYDQESDGTDGGLVPSLGPPDQSTLDPAGLQVLISRLTGIAEEMGAVLRRAAFSPNIKERADCSAALFDAAGELLVQAEHIPVHLGSMPAAVHAAIEAFGEEIEPG